MIKTEEIHSIKTAIIKAGETILQYQKNQNYQIKFKHPGDPVTTADNEANDIIIEAIGKIFPDHVIVSEENYHEHNRESIDNLRKNSNQIWFIDPLDGTKDFIKGLPYFAVSVGFFHNGIPEIGFIYNPAKKFFLHGGASYGIFQNDHKITRKTNVASKLEDLRICISTSEIKQNLFPQLLKALPEDNIEFISSVAYKLGLVAAGEFDLILSKREKSDWDIAAGIALLQNQDVEILDQYFNPVVLNKESILTDGLIVGKKSAIALYQDFLNHI